MKVEVKYFIEYDIYRKNYNKIYCLNILWFKYVLKFVFKCILS